MANKELLKAGLAGMMLSGIPASTSRKYLPELTEHELAQKEWYKQRVQDKQDAMAKIKEEHPELNRKERKKLARKIYQKGW